jgi:hypothetical protein
LQREDLRRLPKFKNIRVKQRNPTKNKSWREFDKNYKYYNEQWRRRNEFLIKNDFLHDGLLVNYEEV